MVNPHAKLIAALLQHLRGIQEICSVIRLREQAQQALRKRIDHAARQLVVRNGRIGDDVEKLVVLVCVLTNALRIEAAGAELSKIPLALGHRGDRGELRFALPIAETLVEPEKKCLVFDDRATESSAELVLLQRLHILGEIVARIDGVIAQELPQGAMKVVGAGARNNIGRGTQRAAKFCVGAVRQNAKFADRVHRRFEHKAAIHAIEIVGAINKKVVGFRPLTIHRIRLAIAQSATRLGQTWRQWHHARLQHAQLAEVAPIQRQIEDFLLLHRLA